MSDAAFFGLKDSLPVRGFKLTDKALQALKDFEDEDLKDSPRPESAPPSTEDQSCNPE